jgi:hypothetical protein
MISDQQLGDALSRQLHDLAGELTPEQNLADRVIRRRRAGRRRARLSGVGGVIAALVAAAVLTVGGSGTPAQTQLGQSQLRLASYTFKLPRRSHAVSATPAACAIGAVVTYEAPGASPSNPQQPMIAQAVTDNGGCVSMLLTAPYTPGAANAPDEAFPVVDQHPVQIGSYAGTVGTAEVVGSAGDGSSDLTINGVSVPSGTTHQFLTVHLPTSDGQVQDLQVAVAGISEQQLVAIVSSGLTQSQAAASGSAAR